MGKLKVNERPFLLLRYFSEESNSLQCLTEEDRYVLTLIDT